MSSSFYSFLLNSQNWLIQVSPGLIPITGIGFSLVNSWHCGVMCGPFLARYKSTDSRLYFLGRVLSYTCVGILFSFLGESLRHTGLSDLAQVVAFFIFLVLTLALVASSVFPKLNILRRSVREHKVFLRQPKATSPFVLGILSSAIPCHLLYLIYGVALALKSPLLGGVLLFNHAIATMPLLSSSNLAFNKFINLRIFRRSDNPLHHDWPKSFGRVLKIVLIALVVMNLMNFAGKIFFPAKHQNKILFCF